jgi:hypothetical protein
LVGGPAGEIGLGAVLVGDSSSLISLHAAFGRRAPRFTGLGSGFRGLGPGLGGGL